jgi:hypothetical protein
MNAIIIRERVNPGKTNHSMIEYVNSRSMSLESDLFATIFSYNLFILSR